MTRPVKSERNLPQLAAALIAAAGLAIAIVWSALHRGPYYDEFYTQYVTRPGIGWWEAFTGSWLTDNHPPLFYVLMRATTWLGDIPHHRLFNLAIAALTLAAGWVAVRRQADLRRTALFMLLVLAANPWTLLSATDLRSYFLSLCAVTLLCLSLSAIWIAPESQSRGRAAVYGVAVMVAFNTHIITTLLAGAMLIPFLSLALVRRDGPRLRALLPAPIVAGLVFAAITAVQLSQWEKNTQVFWISGGFNAARYSIQYAAQRTLEANLPILLCSVAGGVLMLRDAVRMRNIEGLPLACFLTAAGVFLALTLLIGIHLVRPILVEKYLVAMVATLAFLLAATAVRALDALPRRAEPWILAITLAASGAALQSNARSVAEQYSWLGTGQLIAKAARQCPGTTVHIAPYWNADVMAMPPSENRAVMPWAYSEVARMLGFLVAPAPSRTLSRECPNLFWAEHDPTQRFSNAQILEHLQRSGFAVSEAFVYRIGHGWVASDRPLPPQPALP
jgi:hypothetical protein